MSSDMRPGWIDERKPSDGFEPDWEPYVAATVDRIMRRMYRLNYGKEVPEGAILSPANASIIDGEIRKLINELTEHWY